MSTAQLRQALELARDACADVLHLKNNESMLAPLGEDHLWRKLFAAAAADAEVGYNAAEAALATSQVSKQANNRAKDVLTKVLADTEAALAEAREDYCFDAVPYLGDLIKSIQEALKSEEDA